MRNAVIRKKRLRAERMVDDFMRMPQRIVLGANIPEDIDYWTKIQSGPIYAL